MRRLFLACLFFSLMMPVAVLAQQESQFIPEARVEGPTKPPPDDPPDKHISLKDAITPSQDKKLGNQKKPVNTPSAALSEDNVVLIDVRLGRTVIAEGITGYADQKGTLMLPLGQLADALQLAIRVIPQEGQAEGWFLSEDHGFSLDVARREAIVNGKRSSFDTAKVQVESDDIYVDSGLLGQWFPIDFSFSFAEQTVKVSGRDGLVLPVEREAEREQARLELNKKTGRQLPQGPFPRVDTPYQLYTMPFADLTYAGGWDEQFDRGIYNQLTGQVSNDLLYMHSNLFFTVDQAGDYNDLRWTLSRRDPDGKLFADNEGIARTGLADAMNAVEVRELALGDIYTPQLPLTALNQRGRGALVSSMPYTRAERFDRTTLQGDVQPGWEVELYRNDQLIAFQRATPEGRYEFVDVPLLSGLNVLRVVFYGPFGQQREEVQRLTVSDRLTPQGQSYFRAAVSQQDASTIDIRTRPSVSFLGASIDQREAVKGAVRSSFEYEYGVLDNLSAYASASSLTTLDDEARHYVSTGLATTLAGAYGRVDVAKEMDGGNAMELSLQNNIYGVSVAGVHQQFWDFISEYTETVDDPLKSRSIVRADTYFDPVILPRFNAGVTGARLRYTSGRITDEIIQRLTTSVSGVSLTHGINWRNNRAANAQDSHDTRGEWIVSMPLSGVLLRGDMLYGISPTKEIQAMAMTADYALDPLTHTRLAVDKQMIDEKETIYTASVNRKFDQFILGANVSYSDRGEGAVGLTLTTSIGQNPRTGRLEMYPDYAARGGLIAARAFQDANGNGRFDEDETPVEDVAFVTNRGPINMATDEQGQAMLRGVETYQRVSLAVDKENLGNPYLMSALPGVDVVTRPGVPVMIDVPMGLSGDVEGTVYAEDTGGSRKEVANVWVQLVNDKGEVTRETKSSFDGYYLLDAVPAGEYMLRVSPEQAERLGFDAGETRRIAISNNQEKSYTYDLTIRR